MDYMIIQKGSDIGRQPRNMERTGLVLRDPVMDY